AVPLPVISDLRLLHHRAQPRGTFGPRHAFDASAEGEVVLDRHVGVERRRLGKVAGSTLGLDRLIEDVVAGNNRLSIRGRHVAGQHTHGGGFSGAIGSKEPKDLSALSFEAHVVDGRDWTVSLREMLNLYHR